MTSSSSDFSSTLLTSFSNHLTTFKSLQLHSSLLPISILTILHASRVSHATTTLSAPNSPILQSTALALILLFGGAITSAILLSIPSPILLASNTIAIYSLTHIALTKSGLSNLLLDISKGNAGVVLDVALHVIDGICRAEGIVALGVESVRSHSNHNIANSTFAALLIGTLIGGGGPIVLSCFTLTQPTWTLRTPVFLTSPSSLLAVDIWSATFVSFLYLVLTTPGGLPSLLPTNFSNFKPLFTSHQTLFDPLVSIFNLKPTNKSITNHFLSLTSSSKGNSLLDKQQAYVLCGIVLFTILALNRSGRYVLENRNGGQKASKGLPNGLKLNGFDKKSLPSIPKESTNVGLKKKNGK